jgi:hypothetical protein
MFEWLEDELSRIKNRKFHVVDGPMRLDTRELVERSDLHAPRSYKNFIFKFGNANLYWDGTSYRVRVFAFPEEAHTDDGEVLRYFGRTDMSLAYFKEVLLVPGKESPVFEWRYGEGVRQTADSFEEWLVNKCAAERKRFTTEEWKVIEEGPLPFSEQEMKIVEARRKYRWRVVGVAENGDLQFEVHNGSDATLPFLTIGIRGKRRGTDDPLNGGIWLPVGTVLPGQKSMIEKDCYKKWVDPRIVEAFEEPDPEPEDRDRYWEFKGLQQGFSS